MFFAIPLRKFYILKLKLVFPSAVATAFTIRSLHVGYALRSSRFRGYSDLISEAKTRRPLPDVKPSVSRSLLHLPLLCV
jgi:uncharacterized oligopeptide transporter (OPT) family protein